MGRPRFLDIHVANGGPIHSSTSTTTTTTTSSSPYYSPAAAHSAISPLRLTPREESTRVQLQRQRAAESQLQHHHVAAIVTKTIPGIKTSAAFFGSLRTNLRLHASPPPSPVSTPPSMRASATSLPPPSPLSQPTDFDMADNSNPANNAESIAQPEDPLDGVPELKTYITTNEEEKIDALKLVADSIAQMRQTANSALIYHPLNMALVVAVLALTARYMVETRQDTLLAGTTCAGIGMGVLALYRYLTQDYIYAAEGIKWDWLGDADVIITKFGDEVIGTVVVQWVSGESSRQKRKKAWRGEIMAWTVRMRYRKKGVGSALLEEAVKEAKKKGAETVEFADDHANSKRVLPSLYNSKFDKRDKKSRELLADLFETSPGGRGKRK